MSKRLLENTPLIGQGRNFMLVGGGGQAYAEMFLDAGFAGTRNLSKADVVVFMGGADVSPQLYGESPLPATYFDPKRDEMEMEVYHEARKLGKFMVGICRGSQFLNVMNGGKLWQDVEGHTRYHNSIDVATGEEFFCSSTHHQMMRPTNHGVILAIAKISTMKCAARETWMQGMAGESDIEAVFYPDTRSLCFQPHPEYDRVPECRQYFFKYLAESLNHKTEKTA